MKEIDEIEIQAIDEKEEYILKDYSKICTQCNDITQR